MPSSWEEVQEDKEKWLAFLPIVQLLHGKTIHIVAVVLFSSIIIVVVVVEVEISQACNLTTDF